MTAMPEVPASVRTLAAQLAAPTPMRRGSLSTRYVKCGKPGCLCATEPGARHGPYYSLTRAVGGRTRSRFLAAGEAALVQGQLAVGQRFRQRVEAYWEACERWADAELRGAAPAAEKKGSRRPSGRPWRKSSKRSSGRRAATSRP